jgi:hypothetical protein
MLDCPAETRTDATFGTPEDPMEGKESPGLAPGDIHLSAVILGTLQRRPKATTASKQVRHKGEKTICFHHLQLSAQAPKIT